MEFNESAEREYARQYARDLANERQPKLPPHRISFEDAARPCTDPSVSTFPQRPTQASTADGYESIDPELLERETPSADVALFDDIAMMHTQPSSPQYAQGVMKASFSMDEVNARLKDNGLDLAGGPSDHATFAHVGATPLTPDFGEDPSFVSQHDSRSNGPFPSLSYHQTSFASYPQQQSHPLPPVQTSPAGYHPPLDSVCTPPTAPEYAKKSAKQRARMKRSTGMGLGWSVTGQINHPATANPYHPMLWHTAPPAPLPGPHTVSPEPQSTHCGFDQPYIPVTMCARPAYAGSGTQSYKAAAPAHLPAYIGHGTQTYHRLERVAQRHYATISTQPPTMVQSNPNPFNMALPPSPMGAPIPSVNGAFIQAPRNSVSAQRRLAWSASTSQGSAPVASPSIFVPASPYIQAPGTGHAPAYGNDLSIQPYQAWQSNTSQFSGSVVIPQNFVPGVPYQPASSSEWASAHRASIHPQASPLWSSTPPQIPISAATHQSSVPPSSFVPSAAASPVPSLPSNSWDDGGQFENNDFGCCGLTCCEYRCPSDPCPSGCVPSCGGSETCGSIYECTSSCRGSGSVPNSQPLSRSMSMDARNIGIDPTTSYPSPTTPAYGQVYRPPITSPHAPWLPVLGQSQISLPSPLLPVPASSLPTKQCLWVDDTSTRRICGARFQTANDLQLHLHQVHGIDRDSVVVCSWDDCHRHREPFQTPQKLRRHTYIHTGYKKFYTS